MGFQGVIEVDPLTRAGRCGLESQSPYPGLQVCLGQTGRGSHSEKSLRPAPQGWALLLSLPSALPGGGFSLKIPDKNAFLQPDPISRRPEIYGQLFPWIIEPSSQTRLPGAAGRVDGPTLPPPRLAGHPFCLEHGLGQAGPRAGPGVWWAGQPLALQRGLLTAMPATGQQSTVGQPRPTLSVAVCPPVPSLRRASPLSLLLGGAGSRPQALPLGPVSHLCLASWADSLQLPCGSPEGTPPGTPAPSLHLSLGLGLLPV